jgi:hypothetical protein
LDVDLSSVQSERGCANVLAVTASAFDVLSLCATAQQCSASKPAWTLPRGDITKVGINTAGEPVTSTSRLEPLQVVKIALVESPNWLVRSVFQSIARNGIITATSGSLMTTTALSLVGTTIDFVGELFCGAAGISTFVAQGGTTCTFAPSLTGFVSIGTTITCSLTAINIALTSGTNCFFVVTATATGSSLINAVPVHATMSVAIA